MEQLDELETLWVLIEAFGLAITFADANDRGSVKRGSISSSSSDSEGFPVIPRDRSHCLNQLRSFPTDDALECDLEGLSRQ